MWRFCIADGDGWLRFKMDSAESSRVTWLWKEDLTCSREDNQWSSLEIKDSTELDVMHKQFTTL